MIRDALTTMTINLIERGYVPDSLTRLGMRRLCGKRLADRRRETSRQTAQFLADSRQAPVAPVPQKANEQHYEVPAELYRYVLGKHRKYSSCYWADGVSTLDEAEAESLKITCERAELEDGMDILELGCGWGSLTLWMAEHYPKARITAVSNSSSQREYIENEAARRGIATRLRVITADMNEFEPEGSFDRVVSVEMFEHMRNHEELLRRISTWLRPAGKLFVHVFCHRDLAYEFSDDNSSDWMSRYFFTGGVMPSEDLLPNYGRDMCVTNRWRWHGSHYQKTADAWVANIDANREHLMPILADVYGRRDAHLWLQRWRMLFMAGSELFGYGDGHEWYVTHYLFEQAAQPQEVDSCKSMSLA